MAARDRGLASADPYRSPAPAGQITPFGVLSGLCFIVAALCWGFVLVDFATGIALGLTVSNAVFEAIIRLSFLAVLLGLPLLGLDRLLRLRQGRS